MHTHTATYYTGTGRTYTATIFLSSVTITIRYRDDNGNEQDVYWLADDITGFNEKDAGTVLEHQSKGGLTEQLIISDRDLLQAVKKNLRHHRLIGKPHNRMFNSLAGKLVLLFSIVLGFFALGYFWFVPWLGERVAMNFSKEYEIKMGEQLYQSVTGGYTIDERKTAIINSFYNQLQYAVDYPIRVTVVKYDETNAFAIPGGHIVVYDAILDRVKTPEELAALLAHEASHIAKRHSLRNLFRGLARKMFLSLVFGSESGIINVVVNNADNLKGLEFSRKLETEADNNGLQLMAASGINTQGMVRLMELLQQEAGNNQQAAFLNTHPVFNKRIENIKAQIQQLNAVPGENEELEKLFQSINAQW